MASDPSETRLEEQTKAERVYQNLRRRICELELAPGAQLRKNELALEFGVSRAPISEAIARLADEGLIDIYPQSGSFVAPIRDQDIRESMIIRIALEVEVIRRAAELLSDEGLKALQHNLDQQKEAVAANDLTLLDELDAQFHATIALSLDCPRLQAELESCRARLDRQRFRGLRERERPAETLNEHQRIFDALRSREPEYAAAAMRSHLNYVSVTLERSLTKAE